MSLQIIVTLAALFNLAAGQAAPAAPVPAAPATDGPPLQVATPASVQACIPALISWTGGTPPVYVSLISGGDPSSPIIKDFGAQTESSLTWDVDQPSGTSLTVQIRDSKGKINYSDKFNVQPSSACKPGQPGSGGKPGSPSTPPSTPTKPTPGSTTPGSSTPGSTGSATPPPNNSTPNSGSSNTGATTPGSPAGQAPKSDASHSTPGFLALAIAGVVAVFA